MAVSFTCCLNPPPPPTTSCGAPSQIHNTTQLTSASWKSRCVSAAACVIIGSSVALVDGESYAQSEKFQGLVTNETQVLKWSQRRSCPQWEANSLENFVPENLPRPSPGRRRSSTVSHKHSSRNISDCFFL
ncbi:protein CHLOROPLAST VESICULATION [Aristolochia californica]|uniref:protein CHLOROPLAST VESICULATION n=1 Tax=Aristolochia californica TaxID=171875 RepID=UPI0035DB2D92